MKVVNILLALFLMFGFAFIMLQFRMESQSFDMEIKKLNQQIVNLNSQKRDIYLQIDKQVQRLSSLNSQEAGISLSYQDVISVDLEVAESPSSLPLLVMESNTIDRIVGYLYSKMRKKNKF